MGATIILRSGLGCTAVGANNNLFTPQITNAPNVVLVCIREIVV